MGKSIKDIQEEIKRLKNLIAENEFQVARYEDELDNESCYRRDSDKEDKVNEICEELNKEIAECKEKVKRLSELLDIKLKNELREKKLKELEENYAKLEAKGDMESASPVLMEIYALKQDIGYYNAIIKKMDKSLDGVKK